MAWSSPGGPKSDEGGIRWACYALSEDPFKDGAIRDTNFDRYALPVLVGPKIETVILEAETRRQGARRPAIHLTGAVIANAVHDATGVRLLELPSRPEGEGGFGTKAQQA